MTNRREFLKGASLMTLGALAASKMGAANGMMGVDGISAVTFQAPKAGNNLVSRLTLSVANCWATLQKL